VKLFLLFLLLPAQSPAAEPIGHVKFLVGSASVGKRSVELGSAVYSGETLRTSPKSIVRIALNSGAALHLGPATTLTLEAEKSITRLNLERGSVLSRIRKLGPGQKFELKHQQAAMGVRGTTFFTQTKGKDTYLCVCEGEVSAEWPGGKKTIAAKHHDHPTILQPKGEAPPPKDPGHTDDEIAELEKLLT